MERKISPEMFLRGVEFGMYFSLILGMVFCGAVLRNVVWMFSFAFGWLIGYLNFRSTKKDGISTLFRVRAGLEPGKGVFLYMAKFYLRLFATAILLIIGMKLLNLNIILILVGISTVYLELLLISFVNFYLRKVEIV